jgi:hypothetical protein
MRRNAWFTILSSTPLPFSLRQTAKLQFVASLAMSLPFTQLSHSIWASSSDSLVITIGIAAERESAVY